MSDVPLKPKGILDDDTIDKRSSTRVIAFVVGIAGLLLVFVHGWVGWPSLLTAGNALLEFAKWIVGFVILRSATVQSVGFWKPPPSPQTPTPNNPPPPRGP